MITNWLPDALFFPSSFSVLTSSIRALLVSFHESLNYLPPVLLLLFMLRVRR